MRYEHERTRRNAENTLAEANRHLESGKVKHPRHHQMLMTMIRDATETLKHLDTRDDARPYTDTNIGYGANIKHHEKLDNKTINEALDVINRILPHIAYDHSPHSRKHPQYVDRMADDYDDDIDDYRVVNMPRWRSARTGRFLPNLYGSRRVRRVRRRADIDDRYDDDRYNDDTDNYADYADYDFNDYNKYHNRSPLIDNEHGIHDAVARVAADTAVNTARKMSDHRASTHNSSSPVMERRESNRYNDLTNDDMRHHSRYSSEENRKIGPTMR